MSKIKRERPDEDDVPHGDADARAGANGGRDSGDDRAVGGPAKQAVVAYFSGRLGRRPGPGEGPRQRIGGGIPDEAVKVAAEAASRVVSSDQSCKSYYDQVAKDDEADRSMPEGVTLLVQSEPVVVLCGVRTTGRRQTRRSSRLLSALVAKRQTIG